MKIEENVPLGRLTTVGIGGPARHFARPGSVDELQEALAWAAEQGVDVFTIGLGSNLLIADDGVEALVLRLDGELAESGAEDGLLVAGGGATNAVCLHRARAAGLGGFEFACAIPGTIGGGVQMNAGAYGGDWKEILERALVVSADGAEWRTPAELGLEYRRSGLRPGEVVARAEFRLDAQFSGRRSRRRLRSSRLSGRPRSRRTSAPSGASSRTQSTSFLPDGCSKPAGSEDTGSAEPRSPLGTRTSSRTRARAGPPTPSR